MVASKKVPTPGEIAIALEWDITDIRDYCARILEDANDHETALALWSLNLGDADLACEFLELEQSISVAGELTPRLRKLQGELLKRFDALRR